MSRLDILLVNPNASGVYQDLADELTAIEPPVWAGLMATFLRKKGVSVDLLDANALRLTAEQTAQVVKESSPRLVSIVCYGHNPSASTQVMPGAGDAARAIKEACGLDVKVMMVGGHVAALPEKTLKEEAVDFVAEGEGLWTMLFTARALSEPIFTKVPSLQMRMADGSIHRETSYAPLLQDLDADMPAVAWDLLPMDRYRAHNWHCNFSESRQPYACVYTSLGCIFNCSYCCIQSSFRSGEVTMGKKGNSYRMWSPSVAVDQLEYLVKERGVRNVKIADEMFVLYKAHVEGVCDEIIRRKLGDSLNIWTYARVDTLREGMAGKLREAGFRWLGFGVESAVESVRDEVDKGYKQDYIFKAREICRQNDINFGANFIMGLPDDTYETMQANLDLALELLPEYFNVYACYPFPGSPLYSQVLKEHPEWLPDGWSGYGFFSYDSQPLPTKYLTAAEVLKFRDEAFQRYFTDKSYLDMMRHRFGDEAVRQIEAMTAKPLRRRLLEQRLRRLLEYGLGLKTSEKTERAK